MRFSFVQATNAKKYIFWSMVSNNFVLQRDRTVFFENKIELCCMIPLENWKCITSNHNTLLTIYPIMFCFPATRMHKSM